MNLIEKSALVAEIKARISSVETSQKAGMIKKRDAEKKIFLFKSVLSLIDTLEVKEVQEEPVSNDLEEAAKRYSTEGDEISGLYIIDEEVEAFKAGAKWQKAKDQETIELAEDHAMLAGMEKMKEEMMAKAIDVEVKVGAGGYPYIPPIELYDYDRDIPLAKMGDKYKVVLIKED